MLLPTAVPLPSSALPSALRLPPSSGVPLRSVPAAHAMVRSVASSLRRTADSSSSPTSIPIDGALISRYLGDMGLADCDPLRAACEQLACGDLRRFLIASARPLVDNACLMRLLRLQPHSEAPFGATDSEVHAVVHYSLTLHVVTRVLASDPDLAARVLEQQKATTRSQPRWWASLAPFELFKLGTVERSLELFSEHRTGRSRLPPHFGQVGLPINIVEAICEDLRRGQLLNACAGVPLLLARPGSRPAALSADSRRAVAMHMPQSEEWKQLYVSWNLAFTSTWADSPFFAAALAAPCVIGSRTEEFLFHRAFALHLHICAQLTRRQQLGVRDGSLPVQAERDWHDEGVSEAWGRVNLEAARGFHAQRQRRAAPEEAPGISPDSRGLPRRRSVRRVRGWPDAERMLGTTSGPVASDFLW